MWRPPIKRGRGRSLRRVKPKKNIKKLKSLSGRCTYKIPRKTRKKRFEDGAMFKSLEYYIEQREKAIIEEMEAERKRLETKLQDLERSLKQKHKAIDCRPVEVVRLQTSISRTREEIGPLLSQRPLQEYRNKVRPYIEAFEQASSLDSDIQAVLCEQDQPMQYAESLASINELREQRKAQVIQEYMEHVENEFQPPHIPPNEELCEDCKSPLELDPQRSQLGCPKCHNVFHYIDATSDCLAYGDEVDFTSFSYKRIVHFNEQMNLFQAKESTHIPEEIFISVMDYIYTRHGVRSKEAVTLGMVEKALKALPEKDQKYVAHKQLVLCRITGRAPPRLTPQQEKRFRHMFMALQDPFDRWKLVLIPNRKNFMSYNFSFYKFCQICGWSQYLECFTLLKGLDKLMVQDILMEKICDELRWQFVPAIDYGEPYRELFDRTIRLMLEKNIRRFGQPYIQKIYKEFHMNDASLNAGHVELRKKFDDIVRLCSPTAI